MCQTTKRVNMYEEYIVEQSTFCVKMVFHVAESAPPAMCIMTYFPLTYAPRKQSFCQRGGKDKPIIDSEGTNLTKVMCYIV